MADGIGLRYFLFEADGALRRLPLRVVGGLIRGEDRLAPYAGHGLRVADVVLRLRERRPGLHGRGRRRWWEFDAQGSIRRSVLERLADALNTRPFVGGSGPEPAGGRVVDFRGALARRRAAHRWRWTPTLPEITRIVHAIWPETAGRPASAPPSARGSSKRRHPMSLRAREAERKCGELLLQLYWVVEHLGEHELKGLVSAVEHDRLEPTGEGHEHLWQGVKALAEWTLEARRARRPKRGVWYAWVSSMTRDPGKETVWEGRMLEHRVCQGRDAAVAARRELLQKHARHFAHDTRVEADLCPEIEWVGSGQPDDGGGTGVSSGHEQAAGRETRGQEGAGGDQHHVGV